MTTFLFTLAALIGFTGLFGPALKIPSKTQTLLIVLCLILSLITVQLSLTK